MCDAKCYKSEARGRIKVDRYGKKAVRRVNDGEEVQRQTAHRPWKGGRMDGVLETTGSRGERKVDY